MAQDIETQSYLNPKGSEQRKPIPHHPYLDLLRPYFGPRREPETYEEQLMAYIDCSIAVLRSPWFEDGVFKLSEILGEFGIGAEGEEGWYFLETFVKYALGDLYGGFYKFTYCSNCGEKFRPDYSLEYARLVLARRVFCSECSGDEQGSDCEARNTVERGRTA